MTSAKANPMGVEWFGMAMGLGFVLSFGYWCTDFLVVQRAMAANSMSAARRTPLIAAIPKMLFPALVILPGMVAIALHYKTGNFLPLAEDGKGVNYNMVIPRMLVHYFPPGVLGLGVTALMASFMSGMAGNVTAFNTVWTYDIYQSYIRPGQSDQHYLWMGRFTTIWGIALSVVAAYVAAQFNSIMDALQLVFKYVNAPLFATFLLGMFWRRATGHGAFWGLLLGTLAAALHHGLTLPADAVPGVKGAWIGLALYKVGILAKPDAWVVHHYYSEMALNFYGAIWAWTTCFVMTIIVSLMTKQQKSDEELRGLVYSLTPKVKEHGVPWYKQPAALGVVVLLGAVALNIIFR